VFGSAWTAESAKPGNGQRGGRRLSTTKPGTLLRRKVPVLISAWEEDRVGFLEMDLVAHCGDSTAGEYVSTLSTIDLASGWSERVAIMGKSQKVVFGGLQQIREQLPFELRGLHSDNGSEFLNGLLLEYCRAERIAFSRSRPYHKNDNAHVEQKNWSLVRKLIGYQRLDTEAQLAWLNALYQELLRQSGEDSADVAYLALARPSSGRCLRTSLGGRGRLRADSARLLVAKARRRSATSQRRSTGARGSATTARSVG
jgi:hypothetical protein